MLHYTHREKCTTWKVTLFQATFLHDANWTWIGRERAVANCHEINDRNASFSLYTQSQHSPLLTTSMNSQMAKNRKHISRSQSCGAKRSGVATAVLSIAEADRLLLHSPYHKAAWQDTLKSNGSAYGEYIAHADEDNENERLYLNHYAPYTMDSWPTAGQNESANGGIQTIGRYHRRNTTGGVTQRNYQVSIISAITPISSDLE